jgi:hypothetical protein
VKSQTLNPEPAQPAQPAQPALHPLLKAFEAKIRERNQREKVARLIEKGHVTFL